MVTKKVASTKKVAAVYVKDPGLMTLDKQISEMVNSGASLENIAERFGVSVEYIKEIPGLK